MSGKKKTGGLKPEGQVGVKLTAEQMRHIDARRLKLDGWVSRGRYLVRLVEQDRARNPVGE